MSAQSFFVSEWREENILPDVLRCFRRFFGLLFRESVAHQSFAVFSVFDRFARTAADTGHTVSAVIRPDGFFTVEANIAEGTDLRAFSAGDAPVCRIKLFCVDEHGIKDAVYDSAADLIAESDLRLRERIFISDEACGAVDDGFRLPDDFRRLPGCRRGEQSDIIFIVIFIHPR